MGLILLADIAINCDRLPLVLSSNDTRQFINIATIESDLGALCPWKIR
jgi:hypothetical protein